MEIEQKIFLIPKIRSQCYINLYVPFFYTKHCWFSIRPCAKFPISIFNIMSSFMVLIDGRWVNRHTFAQIEWQIQYFLFVWNFCKIWVIIYLTEIGLFPFLNVVKFRQNRIFLAPSFSFQKFGHNNSLSSSHSKFKFVFAFKSVMVSSQMVSFSLQFEKHSIDLQTAF